MGDTLDISKQIRSIYTMFSILNVKFGGSTKIVISLLFQSYCTNRYCSHLWWDYRHDMYKSSQIFFENNVLYFNAL